MIGKFMHMFFVQFILELKIRIRYLTSSISDLVIYGGTFIIVLFFTNTSFLERVYAAPDNGVFLALIGYLFWGIGTSSMDTVSQCIENDATAGILESEVQCAFPLWIINFIKNIASNIYLWVYLIIIGALTCMLSHYSVISLCYLLALTIVFSSISNIGMFGIGLIFGAGSVKFKHMGQWGNLFQVMLLIASNVATAMQYGTQKFIPFTMGIELTRKIFLHKNIDYQYFLLFILINVCWMVLGVVIFNFAISYEKRHGSFEAF